MIAGWSLCAGKSRNVSHGLRAALCALLLAAAPGFVSGGGNTVPAQAALSALGQKIFADESLSASGKMACATCHDPKFAHAQNNALAVQSGGANLDVPGFRSVPSLRYLNLNIPFFFANDGTPPAGPVRESGGLLSLRALTESRGGRMDVESVPSFRLVISLPRTSRTD